MATSMEKSTTNSLNALEGLFQTFASNMSASSVDTFKINTNLFFKGSSSWWPGHPSKFSLPRKLFKCDALTFLRFLENKGFVDETSKRVITENIRVNDAELLSLMSRNCKKKIELDPVSEMLEKTRQPQLIKTSVVKPAPRRSARIQKRKRDLQEVSPSNDLPCKVSHTEKSNDTVTPVPSTSTSESSSFHPVRHSCDVRLSVKAEYIDHFEVLGASVHSNKPQQKAQQLDRFNQASHILKARDLGAVVCDIKFSEITSLDAFWRDYVNGSLLEALKGVFLTETLQQAVGEEPLRLLITVEEDDYRRGRLKLLQNLTS